MVVPAQPSPDDAGTAAPPAVNDQPLAQSPAARGMALITGAWLAQAVQVAAQVGIADVLATGALSATAVADRTGTHPDAVSRLLRALAHAGVVAEDGTPGPDPERRFGLTDVGRLLRSDVPGSLHPFAIMMGSDWVWRSWGAMAHTIRTGETAFEHLFGAPVFAYYAEHPEAARIGAAGLTGRSAAENEAIVDGWRFGTPRRVVDVGGGEGTLLRAVLRHLPEARGALLEMPHVVDLAREAMCGAAEADRLDLVAGDFFAEVPSGADLYLLKKVLHDWADEPAAAVLRAVRAAMPAGSRLLVVEHVVPADGRPSFAVLLDLLMLVYAGGRERTELEYRRLFAASGLTLARVLPTAAGISVLEAVPG